MLLLKSPEEAVYLMITHSMDPLTAIRHQLKFATTLADKRPVLIQHLETLTNSLQDFDHHWASVQTHQKHIQKASSSMEQLASDLNLIQEELKTALVLENKDSPLQDFLEQSILSTLSTLESVLERHYRSPLPALPTLVDRDEQPKNRAPQEDKIDDIFDMVSAASFEDPTWTAATGHIMILDKNPNTAHAMERRLIKEGHTVRPFLCKEEALGRIALENFDVLIIDQEAISGSIDAFFQLLREDDDIGYVPVIVVGRSNQQTDVIRCLEAGAEDYISKPAHPVLLKSRVQSSIEKKNAYQLYQKQQAKLKTIRTDLKKSISNHPHAFLLFNTEGELSLYNRRLFDLYPHLLKGKKTPETDLVGLTFPEILDVNIQAGLYQDLLTAEGSHKKELKIWRQHVLDQFSSPIGGWEEQITNKNASSKIFRANAYRTPDGGTVLIVKDISKKRATEKRLTRMAYQDSLTGLENRTLFEKRLGYCVNRPAAEQGLSAVLFLDLDQFKSVNDQYGHEAGDWLLIHVSRRLKKCVRSHDTVARFGGDEFAVLLQDVQHAEILNVGNRMIKTLQQPFEHEKNRLTVGVSIGISLFPQDGTSVEDLLRNADQAMYQAKQNDTGDQLVFYKKQLDTL